VPAARLRRVPAVKGFDRAGFPFVGGAWLIAIIAGAYGGWVFAVPFVALGAFFAFFFRDPERASPGAANVVLSPADGRVKFVGDAEPGVAPPGEWKQISIFLSPMDVHVNRIPLAGRVTRVSYTPGKFLPAYRAEAASQNERNEIWIEHGGQTIICRQVVGVLARRILCRIGEGAEVTAGQRYGIMKFGSRMDLYLPPDATLTVRVGERVRSGETTLARLAGAREGR
jgi:phosphatidylserine decarboxylase